MTISQWKTRATLYTGHARSETVQFELDFRVACRLALQAPYDLSDAAAVTVPQLAGHGVIPGALELDSYGSGHDNR